MSHARIGPRADTESLLRVAGAHSWSLDAVEQHKADYEALERLRDMPELWQRLHTINPRLAAYALPALYAALIAAAIAAVALTQAGWVTAMPGAKLGLPVAAFGILVLWLRSKLSGTHHFFYYWESLLPADYVNRFGAFPPQIAAVMRDTRALFPDAVFRIEVFAKDPILWVEGLGEGEAARPVRVWDLDGTDVLPPQ